jgi:hypothetical protein
MRACCVAVIVRNEMIRHIADEAPVPSALPVSLPRSPWIHLRRRYPLHAGRRTEPACQLRRTVERPPAGLTVCSRGGISGTDHILVDNCGDVGLQNVQPGVRGLFPSPWVCLTGPRSAVPGPQAAPRCQSSWPTNTRDHEDIGAQGLAKLHVLPNHATVTTARRQPPL